MFVYLDKNFVQISFVDAINLQWRRRFFEYGSFELQIAKSQQVPGAEYIYNTTTGEMGVIEAVDLQEKLEGNYLLYNGYFVESWLSRGVIQIPGNVPERECSRVKNITEVCKYLVQDNVIDDLPLPRLQIGTCKTTTKTTEGTDDQIYEIGLICQSLLKSIDYGQKLRFDYESKKFYYEIWQGVDRSVDGPNLCVFSDLLNNINDLKYSKDNSDYKNFAFVRIDRGNDHFLSTTYSLAAEGEELRKLHVEFSDSESATDAEAIEKGKQQGLLELLNHTKLTTISFTPVLNYSTYQQDFDLGDKVRLNLNQLNESYSFIIIGVNEIYKNNTQEIELLFGDMKKMLYDKRRF